MQLTRCIGRLRSHRFLEIRECTQHDRDIHTSVEQYRAQCAVCFLHDISEGKRKRKGNREKYSIICSVSHPRMEPCKNKGKQENGQKFPNKWLKFTQEQSAKQHLFQRPVRKNMDQYIGYPRDNPDYGQVFRLEQACHGDSPGSKDEESDRSNYETRFQVPLLDIDRSQTAAR